MKKLMVVTSMALVAASLNAMSLAEARGMTDKVIESPSEMTNVMKELSTADQKSFISDVNEAIAKLPASAEEKSAKAVSVNRAALKGATRESVKDLEAVIAEVFASAPLESLCSINESLAKDAMNRASDPKKTYTDEQFTDIAKSLVNAVNTRVAGTEDAAVRGGFAALMMVRASNGSPESLSETLANTLGESAETAKNEWFPEALKDPANYDPMLASTAVEKAPDPRIVAAVAGSNRDQVMLDAFLSGVKDPLGSVCGELGDMSKIQDFDHDLYTRPRSLGDNPWDPDHAGRRGRYIDPEPDPEPGPRPYFNQRAY